MWACWRSFIAGKFYHRQALTLRIIIDGAARSAYLVPASKQPRSPSLMKHS